MPANGAISTAESLGMQPDLVEPAAPAARGKSIVPLATKCLIVSKARNSSVSAAVRAFMDVPGVNVKNVSKWKAKFDAAMTEARAKDADEIQLIMMESLRDARDKSGRRVPVEVINDVYAWFQAQRKHGKAVKKYQLRTAMLRVAAQKCPHILKRPGNPKGWFTAGDDFLRSFRNTHNISVRAATTNAQKLPENMTPQQVKDLFALRVAYVVRLYDIDQRLVVHADESGLHMLPVSKHTYETTGAKSVTINGSDDKRQCTVMVAGTADGRLLKPYVIVAGKTTQSFPSMYDKEKIQFSVSDNHWMQVKNVQEWIQDVLAPHFVQQREAFGLPDTVNCLLLWDVYSAHIDAAVVKWMLESYPWIKVVYAMPGCTSLLNVADVSLNKPLKVFVTNKLLDDLIARGVDDPMPKLPELKNLMAKWIVEAHQHSEVQEHVKNGVRRVGFLKAWDSAVQDEAVEKHAKGKLFRTLSAKDKGEASAAHSVAETVEKVAIVGRKRQRSEVAGRRCSKCGAAGHNVRRCGAFGASVKEFFNKK